jgi:hypothetical protein
MQRGVGAIGVDSCQDQERHALSTKGRRRAGQLWVLTQPGRALAKNSAYPTTHLNPRVQPAQRLSVLVNVLRLRSPAN